LRDCEYRTCGEGIDFVAKLDVNTAHEFLDLLLIFQVQEPGWNKCNHLGPVFLKRPINLTVGEHSCRIQEPTRLLGVLYYLSKCLSLS
jgi:hypothetical protein